jgi:hypothetical protein
LAQPTPAKNSARAGEAKLTIKQLKLTDRKLSRAEHWFQLPYNRNIGNLHLGGVADYSRKTPQLLRIRPSGDV